jgi:hypothetical protein
MRGPFRREDPGLHDYLALGLVGAAYLGVMVLVLAPERFVDPGIGQAAAVPEQ